MLESNELKAFLGEIHKGFTIQQATKNLGLCWDEVNRELDSLPLRCHVVDLSTCARYEKERFGASNNTN
jgi:RNAse (barnase) inhibitor barstar